MSLKYQRIKKQDEALWPPVKWVLRAFSSITLAVTLLTIVCIYGTLTSVPLGQLAQIPTYTVKGLTYAALFAIPFVPLVWLGRKLTRGREAGDVAPLLWAGLLTAASVIGFVIARQGAWGFAPRILLAGETNPLLIAGAWVVSGMVMAGLLATIIVPGVLMGLRIGRRYSTNAQIGGAVAMTLLSVAVAVPLVYVALTGIARFAIFTEFSHTFAATTIYRLRPFEMTELEFYSWWPFQVLLGLFVANLIVATIRRIEFKFVNIGVLTVHTGIITIALGSMVYGSLKKEGDIVLFKPRFGGDPAAHFYDRNKPAVFVTDVESGQRVMIPLPELPRYNDYDPDENELDIRLHEVPEFREVFGDDIEAVIPGFYAYAELQDVWREARGPGPHPDNPSLTYRLAFENEYREFTLFANDPEQRVLRIPSLDLAFFTDVDEDWLETLVTPTQGRHSLVVEVPGEDFSEIYTIEEDGQRITVGDTGFELSVEQTMSEYPFPVMTEGYEGAQPSAAVVLIHPPEGEPYQRWAIDPYPQLTQDFLPGEDGGRPQRVDPNPEIDVTYIDASRIKLTAVRPADAEGDDELSLIYRLPGGMVDVQPLEIGEGVTLGQAIRITVSDYVRSTRKYHEPQVVPLAERTPSEEGVFQHAALPVEISSRAEGVDYHERLWLGHMRYIEYPTEHIRPESFHVPGHGEIEVAFGRVREQLPFALELASFEMIPYPGTGQTDNPIPQDYVSQLLIHYPDGETRQAETRMNNPLMVRAIPFTEVLQGEVSLSEYLALGKIKVSQAEWDPQNQAFTGLGIGNNAAIRVIAFGAVLMSIGIPWAFYVKPAILRARKRRLQRELAERHRRAGVDGEHTNGDEAATDAPAEVDPAQVNGEGEPAETPRQPQHDPTNV